ncbi:GvpL/GvpF family gas vesicle protein [Halochromatium glycolicum]|jgi:hypothetical protein|uniref:Gas vesicle synthesis protein GvpL/GvpF n=1 Tax=Halochromatium glycolicum TaxID=85075 RepID=A0AAJ0U7S5_9GAMM|nr:GvpL/GvpF family gas vesicle protein [Halochromatium glycolicum]MBK1706841.1 hypothetical protein [Halochromatium glycolicum]
MTTDAALEPAADEALYLYCVLRSAGAITLPDAAIDPARPVAALEHAGLTAVVSPVPLAEFRGPQGEQNLADVGWLGPRALCHETVIAHFLPQAAVFPLPFGTLFSSVAALRQELDARRGQIEAALERVQDCREWAVQGVLEREQALDAREQEAIATGRYVPAASAGRQHLEKKRLRRALERDLEAWLSARTAPLADTLYRAYAGFTERRVLAGQGLAFNWAVLVPSPDTERFLGLIDDARAQHAAAGLQIVCKGPWAAYSFCGELL